MSSFVKCLLGAFLSILLLHDSILLNPGPLLYLGAFVEVRKTWVRQLGLWPAEELRDV